MGQAKNRGTFEQRKSKALEDGRGKVPLEDREKFKVDELSTMALFTSYLLSRRKK